MMINGFNGDNRDFFPFEFVDAFPGARMAVGFTFKEAVCYIARLRGFEVECNLAATFEGNEYYTNYTESATRGVPEESQIHSLYRTTNNWPAFSGPRGMEGRFGGPFDVPLTYLGPNSFAPYFQFIEGVSAPDPDDPGGGSEITINTVTINEEPGRIIAAGVTAKYVMTWIEDDGTQDEREHDLTLWMDELSPPITGTITIRPNSYFTYNGVYDGTTGEALIWPPPEGF
jgi:hypothetical protein